MLTSDHTPEMGPSDTTRFLTNRLSQRLEKDMCENETVKYTYRIELSVTGVTGQLRSRTGHETHGLGQQVREHVS